MGTYNGFTYTPTPKTPWDNLFLATKSEMMKVAVKHGITDLKEIRQKYNEFAEGGDTEEERPPIVPFKQRTEVIVTPDQEYNQYLNTLPDNQRFTFNDAYDSYFYWRLNGRPKNFEEAYNKGMFNFDHSDGSYHANSISFGDNGIGYFMKPKTHDTVGYELDWYNKGLVTEEGGHQRPLTPEERIEWLGFRNNYELVNDPDRPNYYRYQPRVKANGGKIHIKPENRGKFTALKERTGHSATWFKEHGTPAQKKMAVFALNSKKWKHGEGGNLFGIGGPTYPPVKPVYRKGMSFEEAQAYDRAMEEYRRAYQEWKSNNSSQRPYTKTYTDSQGNTHTLHRMARETDEQYEARYAQRMQMVQENAARNQARYERRQETNRRGAERFNKAVGVVMDAMTQQADETPFTGLEYQQAADSQRQQRVDAFHNKAEELGLGLKSAATATGIMGGFGALGNQLGLGLVGGEGVDLTTQAVTPYKNWGQMTLDLTGLPEWMTGLTNPGYFFPYGAVGRAISSTAGKAADNAAIAWNLKNPQVPEGYLTIKPQVRTRVGDVEVDNPNLLYHLDRGDGAGAFSNQGAYIADGALFPGVPKEASAIAYSWWNKGKPYSTSVKGQPMTRLMTATEDTPGMLHVRSQNYPIGQWNGQRGFVLNSEYVNPEGVNVSGSTYSWKPNYGWRRVSERVPSLTWGKGRTIMQYNDTGSPYQDLGLFTWNRTGNAGDPSITVKSNLFGDFVGEGSEQTAFGSLRNPSEVLKVNTDRGFSSIDGIRDFHRKSTWMKRNQVPYQERMSIRGYLTNPESNTIYPVYGQGRMTPFVSPLQDRISSAQRQQWENILIPQIDAKFHSKGYTGSAQDGLFTGPLTVGDISPWNIGFNRNGQLRFIDLDVQ